MSRVGKLAAGAFLSAIGCGCMLLNPPPERAAWIPREAGLYRSQVHRGGGGKYPDNALETFLWCWGKGCTPEADARLTKDGVAIAMHDSRLDRIGANLDPRLVGKDAWEMDWADMRDVDIGSKWGEQYATYRLATMESVFAAMKGHPDRLLYLDEKGAPPKMMAEMSADFGVQEQVFYCSPDWHKVVEWRKYAPKGRSMVWLGSWPNDNSPKSIAKAEAFLDRQLGEMEAFGFEGIDQVQIHVRTDLSKPDPFCPSSDYMRKAIERLHRHGVSVNTVTWTEGDNEEVYLRLWKLGFDHFTSDYPDTMFKVIDGLRLKPFITEPGTMKPYWRKGEHVQGMACAPDAVYLGHQHGIFKYGWDGKFIKHVETPHHTGDIIWADGRIYTSVDVLEGPRPLRSGVVQAYDEDLNLIASKDIPQGVDGICAKDGVLYLGMNNVPELHRVNQIGKMDMRTLEFLGRVDIDYGTDTSWGTQDITCDGENFWVAFYSKVPLAVFDRDWKPVRTLSLDASNGLDYLPKRLQGENPRFGRGRNLHGKNPGYRIDFFEFNGREMIPLTK